jgi:MYXO-CTERM domain-containing protein
LPGSGSTFELRTTGDSSTEAVLYAIDSETGWAGGAGFSDSTVAGCMNAPAFAQNTIAVSAYALHVGAPFSPYPEMAGELRGFSGRGPDLWGDPGIDIAAPDNPVVASPDSYNAGVGEGLLVHWSEFGGTSGAGAVTGGLSALVKQANPELSGLQLRAAILAGARSDGQVGAADEWGAGKLGLDLAAAPGAPPTAVLKAPATMAPGHAIELAVELADDGDTALARTRWDFDYDGVWDSDWQDGLTTSTTMPEGVDHLDVKVEAMDADGWVAAAVARIGLGEPPEPNDPAGQGNDSAEAGCGCRTAGAPSRSSAALLLACLAALAFTRRRHSSRSTSCRET